VADANGQRTAGTALANDCRDDRRFQARHHTQVPGNGLALVALLGIDARIGAGSIDEGQDRQLEALGHFHQAASLAIALGTRHAEVAAYLLAYFTPLLVTDHHYRLAVQAGRATDDGSVIGEMTIS